MRRKKWEGDNVKLNIKFTIMKKYFLFLLVIFFTNSSYSQTEYETKEWINNNLSEYYGDYGISNRVDMSVVQCYTYSPYIYNKILYIEVYNCKPTNFGEWMYYIIDVKTLKNIKRFSGPTITYDYNFGTKIDEQLWFTADYIFKTKDRKIYEKIKSDNVLPPSNDVMFILKSNDDRIIEKNIPNRMIKAFEHLVKLYGGNMISDNLF
jgi:hypothetical protein